MLVVLGGTKADLDWKTQLAEATRSEPRAGLLLADFVGMAAEATASMTTPNDAELTQLRSRSPVVW